MTLEECKEKVINGDWKCKKFHYHDRDSFGRVTIQEGLTHYFFSEDKVEVAYYIPSFEEIKGLNSFTFHDKPRIWSDEFYKDVVNVNLTKND